MRGTGYVGWDPGAGAFELAVVFEVRAATVAVAVAVAVAFEVAVAVKSR
jgi:hypothetical protein